MGRRWKLGRLFGIDLYIHWTFAILPLMAVLTHWSQPTAMLIYLVLIVAVFSCVLLHELGHALAARYFGIGTHDIILLPIGGVARLHHIPEKPLEELVIAVAGPLVNVVIAAGLFLLLIITGTLGAVAGSLSPAAFSEVFSLPLQLLVVNVMLVLFNMLPAFPMDGGRVFRAILAMFLPYLQATKVAATVGKFVAVGIGLFGLLNLQPMLVFLALFVYFAGRSEAKAVEIRERMRQMPFGDSPLHPPVGMVIPPTS